MGNLPTTPQPQPAPAAKPKGKPAAHPRDAAREVVETIVFVVALVLMLKLFVVEAFVIPTGSMAETLLGYNKLLTCPECKFDFPVNSSNEVEPADGVKRPVVGACCPNCRYKFRVDQAGNPGNRSGDRVLVQKALDLLGPTKRGDVVVFKYPVDPQVNHTAQNYIKRKWGQGGETVAIHRGDLYLAPGLRYPEDAVDAFNQPKYPRPAPGQEDRLWEIGDGSFRQSKTRPPYQPLNLDFTYHNTDLAVDAFEASRADGFPAGRPDRFELIRKPDDLALSMRRVVYDNDHQSKFLADHGVPARWTADGPGWRPDSPKTPRAFAHTGGPSWLRYRHRVSGPPVEVPGPGGQRDAVDDWGRVAAAGYQDGLFPAAPITNFLGYNAGVEQGGQSRLNEENLYWVGDLMLECSAKFGGPNDEVTLELSKGVLRFQARFAGGAVTVSWVGPGGKDLASRPTKILGGGTHALRFANFDGRLRVWVDGKRVDFGTEADTSPADGAGYEAAVGALAGGAFAPRADGPTLANDVLAPAGVAAAGAVEVSKLVLWEDTYFTPAAAGGGAWVPPETVDTFYVQPGHSLCLGDNSGQSSDSRAWGLVPDRLMLGRAVFVFWPPLPPGNSRVGFIR